jgi:hypothetical protein
MTHTTVAAAPARGFTLRQILGADAATCFAFGLLLVAGAGLLAPLLGLPQTLLFYAGVVLFPCAVLMIVAARSLARPLVWLVVAGNAAWVVASIAVLVSFDVTSLGAAFVLAQAAAVALLTGLEGRAARRR